MSNLNKLFNYRENGKYRHRRLRKRHRNNSMYLEESSKEWTSLLYILSREDTFEDQCRAGFKELVTG